MAISQPEPDWMTRTTLDVVPLALAVNAAVKQRDELKELVGEMLATFELPANAPAFAGLGDQWAACSAGWARRFKKITFEE